MALMLVVLMVLTVITVTLVGTGVRDQQSARLSAGRSEARLLAASVFEDFFSRLKEDPTGLYDLLGSNATDGLAGSVFAGYNTAFRRTTAPKWAVLPSIGRTSQTAVPGAVGTTACAVDDFTQDCFHVEIPTEDRLGPVNAPGSFLLRVNMRLRCGGVEARCIYSSFEQRVRRVQFYDFALAQEFTTLAPAALFPAGSFDAGRVNHAEYDQYNQSCGSGQRASARSTPVFSVSDPVQVKTGIPYVNPTSSTNWRTGQFTDDGATPFEFPSPGQPPMGCLDIAYQGESGTQDDLGDASIYTRDDYLTVCGNPALTKVFLSGPGFGVSGDAFRRLDASGGCSASTSASPPQVFEKSVPAMSLPAEKDVLLAAQATAQSVPGVGVCSVTKAGPAPIEITFSGASWSATNGNTAGSCFNSSNTVIVVNGDNHSSTPPGSSRQGSLDVMVKGTVDGNVSLVVKGSVAIVDDLTYAGSCTGADRKNPACLRNVVNNDNTLSITASERIEIWQSCSFDEPNPADEENYSCIPYDQVSDPTADPTRPKERVVHAILTSPEGYVGVPDWLTNYDDSGAAGIRAQATLHFFGAIASKYQGVFGGFDSGELLSGYFKKFAHDERLTKAGNGEPGYQSLALPPYLVESTSPVWVRLDLSEVGYQGS